MNALNGLEETRPCLSEPWLMFNIKVFIGRLKNQLCSMPILYFFYVFLATKMQINRMAQLVMESGYLPARTVKTTNQRRKEPVIFFCAAVLT